MRPDDLKSLQFSPQEGKAGVYCRYFGDYLLLVDFANQRVDYGALIKADSSTTQNFNQAENWVILECVCRLLEKGYPPRNITLEKTWSAGHGTSGRLDICVARDDGSDYLLIECKTWGKEFHKELSNLKKNGGQLFTYFKFSNKADVIALYTSTIETNGIQYHNEIVRIQDIYRSGSAADFYQCWDKFTVNNGIFETHATAYGFKSRALTHSDLVDISQADSSVIFNQFLEILRHNVISDKPNAFNKIFALFLCKIYDEKMKAGTDEELHFQWKEGVDNHIDFQFRLTDLFRDGMKEFLDRNVADMSKKDFEHNSKNLDAKTKAGLYEFYVNMRLKKNNEFAIKEVFDDVSFDENAKVVKEVVELLQGFKLRYAKKQQYLSDFFELLLTTGLKQEVGQYFTTLPVAQFIVRSLPYAEVISTKLKAGKSDDLLPYVIDYAAGSGHFLTESMHEVQEVINVIDAGAFNTNTQKYLSKWRIDHYDWAMQYIYGIEKDYRLVRVGKVGCYLHGDGLANVLLSDGLANFVRNNEYKNRLKLTAPNKTHPQENRQFDILVSNPPYSVSAFKNNARDYYGAEDFELYSYLTDSSSEIEVLFIERMKQLLKDDGHAGIILPASILSNGGIYERARAMILAYFKVVAIVKLGSNTFMETGTNTVVLFLTRRNNHAQESLRNAINTFLTDQQDVTMHGVECPVACYVAKVWQGITLEEYRKLLRCEPCAEVLQHDVYRQIDKALRAKQKSATQAVKRGKLSEADYEQKCADYAAACTKSYWDKFLALEKEKLYYFILAYSQKTVIVNTGEKEAEKQFLGYYFSKRRGDEGIHAIQGRDINECTRLFDPTCLDNPEKASTYIQQAFKGDFSTPIHESLQNNISRHSLIDLMNFNHATFDKSINTVVKKKALTQ